MCPSCCIFKEISQLTPFIVSPIQNKLSRDSRNNSGVCTLFSFWLKFCSCQPGSFIYLLSLKCRLYLLFINFYFCRSGDNQRGCQLSSVKERLTKIWMPIRLLTSAFFSPWWVITIRCAWLGSFDEAGFGLPYHVQWWFSRRTQHGFHSEVSLISSTLLRKCLSF